MRFQAPSSRWRAVALFVLASIGLASSHGGEPADRSLAIQAAGTKEQDAGKPTRIVGPDARVQLVVTATTVADSLRDATREVVYSVSPEGVIAIDRDGLLTPLKNGSAKVVARTEKGLLASVEVTVTRFDDPPSINFGNRITPIFTKLGCNSGACHGKSDGQNGFRLSLLGFEPTEDYEYLVQESFGRRISPAAPEHSLLLLKATGTIPHGGGEALAKGSDDYRLLTRWIAQGMPLGAETDPVVTQISVYPRKRTLSAAGSQQLKVVARYSDGSTEDVSRTARYEPNDKEMATIDAAGCVKMLGLPGGVAVMIRYQDHVAVFEATVPIGAEIGELPPIRNYIDEWVQSKFKTLGLPPSPVCDDSSFLRRVTLDIAGRLPTSEESRGFLEDARSDKRSRWIDRMLASEDYANYFANKWSAILRNKRTKQSYRAGNFAFHEWLRVSLLENKPYDRIVAELLTASGEASESPAVSWYRQIPEEAARVEDTAQVFLGVRLQCARCHHHPFERWSRQDYYGMSAFFSRLGRKDGDAPDEYRVYHKYGTAQATNPKTKKPVKPTGLGDQPMDLTPEQDPRVALVDWLSRSDNPFFGPTLVNRYWKHFFGRGIVDPEDDMRATNPPTNEPLLKALAEDFVEGGFDLKQLVRRICNSTTYQLSSLPNETNGKDKKSFSRFYPRRLNAEVLLDAIDQFSGTTTKFGGLPSGMRAVQIPDHGGVNSYFLTVFGRPAGASACECERSIDASLAQSLHLTNSREMEGKLTGGVAKTLAADGERSDREKIEELYYRAFSRPPLEEEQEVALAHISKFDPDGRQKAYEDIVWALINTKEFLFNH